MHLLLFWQNLKSMHLLLLEFDQRVQNKLQVADKLGGDIIGSVFGGGAEGDCAKVEEGEVTEIKLAISCHC